jgi:broad specificity phosphatase PhoE
MPSILLIRHPRTTWNDAGRYQGRLDAPLSEGGRKQMACLVELFSGADITAVYTSPLDRAATLADALSLATGAPLLRDERLAEIGLGDWQGLYRDQIRAQFPQMFADWYARPQTVRFPGGETVAEVQERTSSWLDDVFTAYPEQQNIIAVSHSAAIQVLSASALGLDLQHLHRVRIDNCSISTLVGFEPPGILLSLNDRRALSASPLPAVTGPNPVSLMERRASY